jgi:hypothetical protein
MGEHMQLGIAPRHHMAIEPDEAVAVVEGDQGHVVSPVLCPAMDVWRNYLAFSSDVLEHHAEKRQQC